jgi:hypothetical protein
MTERSDWPQARLTPLARARALAAAIPGAGYHEAVFDVPYDDAWPRLADLAHSVPAADRAVRRIHMKGRRTLADGAEELRFTATSPLGFFTPFTARLEDGYCLMRAKGRIYVVVMAAEPTDDGRTVFGQLEAVPRRGGRLLRWLMRITTADDIKGFRRVASGG